MINLSNHDVIQLASKLAKKITIDSHIVDRPIRIYCIARGGIPIGYLLVGLISNSVIVDSPSLADIFVDDLIDSGATQERYTKYNKPFYVLIDKRTDEEYQDWITFPFERSDEETPVIDNLIRVEQYMEESSEEEFQPIRNKMLEILGK